MDASQIIAYVIGALTLVTTVAAFGGAFALGRQKSYDK